MEKVAVRMIGGFIGAGEDGKTRCDDCGYWVPFDVPLNDILK